MNNSTRNRLLEAAIGIYSRKGSRGMTTRAVAREADVSELTLFRHFGSKQGLLTAISEHFSRPEDLDRLFQDARTGEIAADLAIIANNVAAAMRSVQTLMRVQLMEVVAHPEQQPPLASRPEAAIARMSEFLQERQRAGQIREGDTVIMAHIFLATIFARTIGEPIFRRAVHRTDAEVIATLVHIFLGGVASTGEEP